MEIIPSKIFTFQGCSCKTRTGEKRREEDGEEEWAGSKSGHLSRSGEVGYGDGNCIYSGSGVGRVRNERKKRSRAEQSRNHVTYQSVAARLQIQRDRLFLHHSWENPWCLGYCAVLIDCYWDWERLGPVRCDLISTINFLFTHRSSYYIYIFIYLSWDMLTVTIWFFPLI